MGFDCGGYTFDNVHTVRFRTSWPIKACLTSAIYSEMAKVVVMYCLEYCVTDVAGNKHLGVGPLMAALLFV